jgi:integrating conjugative element protein (TIGR03761 family)
MATTKKASKKTEALTVSELVAPQPLDAVQDTTQTPANERQQANPEVSLTQAHSIKNLGSLRAMEEDTMTLHTVEAMRIYLGVSPTPESSNKYGISGAKRAAAALRQLHVLTVKDNPYADWMLIQVDAMNADAAKAIESMEAKFTKKLESLKARGLSYSLVGSRTPQTVSLGYRSPYGFAVTNTVVGFDYMTRVLKSAELRDLMTKAELHSDLERIKGKLRGMFEFAAKAQRILLNPLMQPLCRADYAAQDTDAAKRIAAAKQAFGDVPQPIFTHAQLPRHTLWNQRLSTAEREMLERIANNQEQITTDVTMQDISQITSAGLV